MPVPQITITLNPQGDLIGELPGLNGSRHKIPLNPPPNFTKIIGDTIQTLTAIRDQHNLNIEATETTEIFKKHNTSENKLIAQRASEKAQTANLLVQNLPATIAALTSILDKDATLNETLTRILTAQLENKSKLGEDGAPTNQQVNHWDKHSIFSDPMCPFCKAEGRFETGKNRERTIKNLSLHEALTLGLVARGYKPHKHNPHIFQLGKMSAHLTSLNKIHDQHNVFWSKADLEKLIKDGKQYALETNFEPQEYKKASTSLGNGVTVKRHIEKVPNKPQRKSPVKSLKELSF